MVRNRQRLETGLQLLQDLKEAAKDVDVRPDPEGYIDLALALDLRGSLYAAEATLCSEVERRESRGAYQRSDYPDIDPDQRVSITVRLDENGQQTLFYQPVPPIPNHLKRWIDQDEELSVKGRLLE